ncbi:MAG: co-chaperone GroES [Vampirovibrionales bacterium]|nr:co-chaperone GroES [Vampirovibrionales bacterium]
MSATKQKLQLQPLADRVVIEVIDDQQTTAGGIYIPDTAREKPVKGRIIAIGTGRTLDNGTKEPMTVKVGDLVMFAKYGGTELKQDGVEYKIMAERDILGILAE